MTARLSSFLNPQSEIRIPQTFWARAHGVRSVKLVRSPFRLN